ncbi:hypothetical protein F4809DRAFT_638821 [Biscogniauxia mediterranea]|nr:hypothetical protein F4809DRAFT_638821 [Biscogniauxia mediterranea]
MIMDHKKNQLMNENLVKAVVTLSEDGLVVLDGAVSAKSLDLLNPRVVEEARALRDGLGTWFNYDFGQNDMREESGRWYHKLASASS